MWVGFWRVEVDDEPAPSPKFHDHVSGHSGVGRREVRELEVGLLLLAGRRGEREVGGRAGSRSASGDGVGDGRRGRPRRAASASGVGVGDGVGVGVGVGSGVGVGEAAAPMIGWTAIWAVAVARSVRTLAAEERRQERRDQRNWLVTEIGDARCRAPRSTGSGRR